MKGASSNNKEMPYSMAIRQIFPDVEYDTDTKGYTAHEEQFQTQWRQVPINIVAGPQNRDPSQYKMKDKGNTLIGIAPSGQECHELNRHASKSQSPDQGQQLP